ncbi:MAG: S9 family peptidase [Acidobacteriota bacterium]
MKAFKKNNILFVFILIFLCIFFSDLSELYAKKFKKLTISRLFDPDQAGFSGSLPTRIEWAKDGKNLFFVTTDEKTKKSLLWKYDAEKGEKKVFLDFEEVQKAWEKIARNEEEKKKRFSFLRYTFSPDEEHLLFSHAGDLFYYIFGTKELKKLTASIDEEQNPEFSSDGKYIAYTRKNNLYAIEVSTGLEIQLTSDGSDDILNGYLTWVYFEELFGRSSKGFWWSPDSKKIAFYHFDESPVFKMTMIDHMPFAAREVPVIYPKAGMTNPLVKVGIVSLDTQKTIWMNPEYNEEIYIARANWLPDSKKISLQILNRDQNKLDLLLADSNNGECKEILQERQDTWVDVKGSAYFFKTKPYLLWTSDADGWNHLYLYNLEGKLIQKITKGKWSIGNILHVDEENEWIYFISNKESSLERHFYKVRFNGDNLEKLTSGMGSHSVKVSPAANYFVDTYDTISTPPRMDLYNADGSFIRTIDENRVKELEEYRLNRWEFLYIPTEDGLKLPAMILKPSDFDPKKKYPVIFSIYGGPLSQSVINRWGGTRGMWYQYLAQNGIIVFSMDNRGSAHFGKEGASRMYRNLGYWEIVDYVSGVKYLSKLPYVDKKRIGIWGWSYGGYSTLMAMLTAPDYFQVGVSVAPVTHWKNYDTIYTERYMGQPKNNPEGYEKSAPINHADKLKGKLLIIHGTLDDNVHFQNSVQMANSLISKNKQFMVMIYPGRNHGIYGDNATRHLFTLITDFLLENLKE